MSTQTEFTTQHNIAIVKSVTSGAIADSTNMHKAISAVPAGTTNSLAVITLHTSPTILS